MIFRFILGFGGSYSAIDTSAERDNAVLEEEIGKIRRHYEAAKKNFHKIPDALKEMPKINPEGLPLRSFHFR